MAVVFSLLLCGCGEEDVYQQDDADNAIGTVLSLQVNTAAYRSAAGTRTNDAGITTTFAYGDRLGVIVSHDGGSTEHIVYTYTGSLWSTPSPMYYDNKASYTAYYPYKEDLDGKTLAEVKAAFIPLTDQSDYVTGYAASDLMMCENAQPNTTDKKLQITLVHAFSMLRMSINIPVKTKNANNDAYEASTAATDIAFYIGNTPYRAWVDNGGYARLIVNSGSDIAVKSCYTVSEKRIETSCNISFVSGRYYTVIPPCVDL